MHLVNYEILIEGSVTITLRRHFLSRYSTLNSRVRVLQIAALQSIAVSYINVCVSFVFPFLILYRCVFVIFVVLLWRRGSEVESPASHLEGRIQFQASP